ncbi:SIS domain-containing protein [Streptantibioticus parmotrematis]|uniref:SIS domain-containing protein n=1 Tax=Streptantibioticus parmotrematis TaxID=2873249 RepID=UPI0033CAA800
MFDESQLDHPDALARADTGGLLLGVAAAGARVRTAARHAAEAGIADLKPDGRPRTVLIAGPGSAPRHLAGLLGAFAGCPVLPVPTSGATPAGQDLRWALPGWAGPLDLLLLATYDGTEPGLTLLVEQAYRHGCTVAAVAPGGSPLTGAVQQAHGLALPFAPPPFHEGTHGRAGAEEGDPGALWALLTPLLALVDRVGLAAAGPGTVQAVADRLDQAADRFGPVADTYRNPAKTLAAELDGSLPLVWSEGPLTAPVAHRFAAVLTARAGRPALAAALPQALTDHAALLAGSAGSGDDLDDFFRDRVEESASLRPRVVLLREPDGPPGTAAIEAAHRDGTPISAIDAPSGSPAEALAELIALTDFAAVYLALASATPGEDTTA